MADEKKEVIKVVIDVDDNGGTKVLNEFNSELERTKELTDDANDELDKTSKNTKKVTSGFKGMKTAIKGVGTALKAIGIGAIIALFAKAAQVLSQNAVVMDGVNKAVKGVELVFKDLVGFFVDNAIPTFDKVREFFANLTFDKIATAIKENLIERFKSFLEVLGFVGEAVVKFVSGDFQGALDSAKEAGKEMVDVWTGVDGTVDKVGATIKKGTEAVTGYFKGVVEQATTLVDAYKGLDEALATQELAIQRLEVQQEKLRQARDDEAQSIQDRIAANEALGVAIDQQEQAAIKAGEALVRKAELDLQQNNTEENRVALLQAQAQAAALLEQVETARSEQQRNSVTLQKQAIDLDKQAAENVSELALRKQKFTDSQIENDLERLEAQRATLEQEKELELQRLEDNINLYKEGTQARLDAEAEYNSAVQSYYEQDVALQKQTEEAKRKEAEKTAKLKELKEQAALDTAQNVANSISALAKEGTVAAKVAALAQAIINTYQGVTAELATKTTTPWEFGLKIANIASVIAIGFANVRKILAVDTENPTASAGGVGGGPGVTPRTVAPSTPSEREAQDNPDQDQIEPQRAYVLSSDVTSQAAMQRQIEATATL